MIQQAWGSQEGIPEQAKQTAAAAACRQNTFSQLAEIDGALSGQARLEVKSGAYNHDALLNNCSGPALFASTDMQTQSQYSCKNNKAPSSNGPATTNASYSLKPQLLNVPALSSAPQPQQLPPAPPAAACAASGGPSPPWQPRSFAPQGHGCTVQQGIHKTYHHVHLSGSVFEHQGCSPFIATSRTACCLATEKQLRGCACHVIQAWLMSMG